jgi:hypothetical protein
MEKTGELYIMSRANDNDNDNYNDCFSFSCCFKVIYYIAGSLLAAASVLFHWPLVVTILAFLALGCAKFLVECLGEVIEAMADPYYPNDPYSP